MRLNFSPKTGELVGVDGRGRKRSSSTTQRVRIAARRSNEGISKYKMASLDYSVRREKAMVHSG